MDRIADLIERYCGDDDLVLARTWTAGSAQEEEYVRSLFAMVQANPSMELTTEQNDVLREFGFSGEGFDAAGPRYMLAVFHYLTHANPKAVSQSGLNLSFRAATEGRSPTRKVTFKEYDHHLTHATCAAVTSPFEDAAVAVIDGSGEGMANAFFERPPIEAANLARTGQQVFCDVAALLLNDLAQLGISDNLVLTGGCALNSAWNGQVLSRTPFKALHVFAAPASRRLIVGASAEEGAAFFIRELERVLSLASAEVVAQIRQDLIAALGRYVTPRGVELECAAWLVTARRSAVGSSR